MCLRSASPSCRRRRLDCVSSAGEPNRLFCLVASRCPRAVHFPSVEFQLLFEICAPDPEVLRLSSAPEPSCSRSLGSQALPVGHLVHSPFCPPQLLEFLSLASRCSDLGVSYLLREITGSYTGSFTFFFPRSCPFLLSPRGQEAALSCQCPKIPQGKAQKCPFPQN